MTGGPQMQYGSTRGAMNFSLPDNTACKSAIQIGASSQFGLFHAQQITDPQIINCEPRMHHGSSRRIGGKHHLLNKLVSMGFCISLNCTRSVFSGSSSAFDKSPKRQQRHGARRWNARRNCNGAAITLVNERDHFSDSHVGANQNDSVSIIRFKGIVFKFKSKEVNSIQFPPTRLNARGRNSKKRCRANGCEVGQVSYAKIYPIGTKPNNTPTLQWCIPFEFCG